MDNGGQGEDVKPYGVRFVGPICREGCCWKATALTTFKKRVGHGPRHKKRERRIGREEMRREI